MNTVDESWMDVGSLTELPKLGARTIKTPRGNVALFRTQNDEVFALRDQCPHRGGPLSQGIVHGRSVTCPLHNWVISLETGEATGADKGCTPRFNIRLEGNRILLQLWQSRVQAAE